MNHPIHKLATNQDLFDLPKHTTGEIIHCQLLTRPWMTLSVIQATSHANLH